jgi:nucleoid-associated protein YgaU
VIDIRSVMPEVGTAGRLGVLAVTLVTIAVACSDGDGGGDATEAPATPATTEAPATSEAPEAPAATETPEATEAPEPDDAEATDAPAAPDFGSGSGSITIGDETFELAIGPGTGLCRDVFGIIQAGGEVTDGRDIRGEFSIPPLDWESFDDGRYDPPEVQLEITSDGDDNARWIADAGWAAENDKVGLSQVDSFEKDVLTASGTATFANAWDATDESIQGSFQVSCAEG